MLDYARRLITPACRVYHTANQSISHNTNTVLAFNSERFDNYGMHDTATNNSRITIRRAGIYLFFASIKWDTLTGSSYETRVRLKLNGATVIAGQAAMWGGGVYFFTQLEQSVASLYECAAGDYGEVEVYQNTGGALSVLASGNLSPEFQAVRVGNDGR